MVLKIFIILLLTILSHAGVTDNRIIVENTQRLAAIGQLVGILPPNLPGYSMKDPVYQKRFEDNSRKGFITKFNFCSAVLFTSNKIATAAHCATTYQSLKSFNVKVEFVSADKRNQSVEIKDIFNMDQKNDWAVLNLSHELTTVKPMQFFKLRKSDEQKISLLSVGFPGLVKGKEHFGEKLFSSSCRILRDEEKSYYKDIQELKEDVYLTDCFVSVGNSGGPILVDTGNGYYIIGINAMTVMLGSDVKGIAVPARVILNAIKE